MFHCATSLLAAALLACTSTAVADHHETSTRKEFRELGNLAIGRWVGDIKFIADWPGQELGRGKQVTGYTEYSWAADKHVIRNSGIAGNVTNIDTFAWDPNTKQIKLFSADTAGGLAEIVIWKKSKNEYGWRITGGGVADGRAHAGKGEWLFSDDGKTMTIQGQTSLGDKKNAPLKDVYKRLSP